jgi:hypothetical protein
MWKPSAAGVALPADGDTGQPVRFGPLAPASSRPGGEKLHWRGGSRCAALCTATRCHQTHSRCGSTPSGVPVCRCAGAEHERARAFAQVFRVPGVELVNVPRADPVVLDVHPEGVIEVAHDDPNLHCLGEERLAHRCVTGPARVGPDQPAGPRDLNADGRRESRRPSGTSSLRRARGAVERADP